MEIIHIILGKANPNRMNGVNKVVNELAYRQYVAGKQVEIWGITVNPVHDYPDRVYTTRLFEKSRNPFHISSALKQAILEKQHSSVFHLHGGFIAQMYSVAMWLKRHNVPFVFTPHGSYNTIAMQRSSFRKKLYFSLFEKRLLKAASSIHSLGKSEIAGLQMVYPNNKSVLIPYGYDIPKYVTGNHTSRSFIIGYCGRLDVYTKGLKELLQGFASFQQYHPEAVLWIIGDGPEKEQLMQTATDLALDDSVVFHGARFGQEKNELLQQCQVFAAPSRNEGLPTAVLEAAAMGIPCLVTEATNTGDYIREYDAGIVIDKTCATEIHKGLTLLYNRIRLFNEALLLQNNARTMVANAFNWDTVVARFQLIYQL